MDETKPYLIRNMTQHEVEQIAVEWAAKEGWNPGLHDALCFYSTDPQGFFAGFLGNEPIACISAVAYDPDFAFIGFYIVKPEHRGRGYGLQIWNAAMTYLQTRNIGLDGVVEQQDNYKKSGFEFAYRNIRYEGTAHQPTEPFPGIVPASEVAFNEIVQYDAGIFPVPRPQFLQGWLKQPESLAFVALQGGKVAGYSVIRRCRTGYKIGPLFADNKDLAHQLFLASGNHVQPGTPLFLDTPAANQAAIQLAEAYGMKKVFETARMYTKYQPAIDLNKIYGVTTFELG